MAEGSSSKTISPLVVASGATSGLSLSLHPLPILNISDHYNRVRLTNNQGPKLIGALLGTQSNRDVSIVNSFEVIYGTGESKNGEDVEGGDDVDMGGRSAPAVVSEKGAVDAQFLVTRTEQFKQVFPTLDVIGWYSVGPTPQGEDVILHQQFAGLLDSPIFLLFNPSPKPGSQDIPIKVYEAALVEAGKEDEEEAKFIELDYGIETGEAERIAVDGVSRGGMGSEGDDGSVANLTTQRNAIRMLYERILVLLQYVISVMDKTAKPDHNILRQISALVATLPTMDAISFHQELASEYSDIQLAAYLNTLTKQLSALSDFADKHNMLYPSTSEDFGGGQGGPRGGRFGGGNDPGGRRRK